MKYQRGFILVTTLWLMAAMGIAVGFFALWSQRTLSIAQQLQTQLQGEIDMVSTRNSLFYLLSTQRFTIAGLTVPLSDQADILTQRLYSYQDDPARGTELKLDDRPYKGMGSAYFALQDLGGLINLNIMPEPILKRFLGVLGISSQLQDGLVAKLKDYIDLDDLHRLNGAEASHYQQAGLLPPTNRHLTNPLEAQRVLEWAEQLPLWKDYALSQLTDTSTTVYPNFNTAPLEVLQATYNFDLESSRYLIEAREQTPFYRSTEIHQLMGSLGEMNELDTNYYASGFLRMTLWIAEGQRMKQIRFAIKDKGEKPWLINYQMELRLLPVYTEKTPHHVQIDFLSQPLPTTAP